MEIHLSNGGVALVDDEDYERLGLGRWKWRRSDRGYATRAHYLGRRDGKSMIGAFYLHRVIMGDTPDVKYDHINGNMLDCRKDNLRRVTNQQNNWNRAKTTKRPKSSRFKGVCWHKKDRRWVAKIVYGYRRYSLGTYRDEEDAARAYDAAARELFGPFACVNFPQDGERPA